MAYSQARVDAIRARMAQEGLDALYVRGLSSVVWATGFERVFDTEDAHALVVTGADATLHSDSRYAETLRARAEGTPLVVDAERRAHAAFLFERLEGRSTAGGSLRVGVEDSLALAEFRALERRACDAGGVELVELSGFVEGLRECKDAAEVAAMRRAQAITDAAFSRIVDWMAPGMTEREVQLELDRIMFELGAEGLAFDTIVAAGAHASSPHAIPGDRVLELGDAVVMDFGAKWAGYCSDMTRTVFLGRPSDDLARAWKTLRRANEECEALLKAGVTGAQAHAHAEAVLTEGGFAGRMGHALGHSVGIDIHEGPNLSSANSAPLRAGNVVTVEPGIYVPGSFGMRLEDFGVVAETGYEVFTQSTHEMIVL